MKRLRCVQLADDFALGGVSKGLAVYDHPGLREVVDSRVEPVSPAWRLAPRFDADVIITHFPPSWRTLPYFASLRLRNRHARLIHVEHSYTGAWEALKVPNRARFRRMMRIALSIPDEIVAVSLGQAQWLTETGLVAPQRLHVLHPWSGAQGLDLVAVARPDDARVLRLAAYGRFAEAKGFDVLIDAVKTLDPTRFTLTLGGFGADDAALRARAARHPNIRFAGRVDDVAGFLAEADVVVVPSRWEAFGQVAAEARMAGRPIVVAAVDGLAEQAVGAGFTVDCADSGALASLLSTLPSRSLDTLALAARETMADAENQRIAAWVALFARASAQLSAAEGDAARAATPMSTSPGQMR